jgi:hypothetical protein
LVRLNSGPAAGVIRGKSSDVLPSMSRKLPDGSLDVGAIQVEKEIPPPQ